MLIPDFTEKQARFRKFDIWRNQATEKVPRRKIAVYTRLKNKTFVENLVNIQRCSVLIVLTFVVSQTILDALSKTMVIFVVSQTILDAISKTYF